MTLLEDIRAERQELSEEIRDLATTLSTKARQSVAATGVCPPVAAAIVGVDQQLYKLSWRSAHERAKVFEGLNSQLAEDNATGSIIAIPGNLDPYEAIIVITRAPGWKEMKIYPYVHDPDGQLHWLPTEVTSDFPDTYLQVPALN